MMQRFKSLDQASLSGIVNLPATQTALVSEDVEQFIFKTLREYPGLVGPDRMWQWWRAKSGAPESTDQKSKFREIFKTLRKQYGDERGKEKSKLRRRREARRQHRQMTNVGYTEPDPMPEVTSELFTEEQARNSLVEDRWKAEYYFSACSEIDSTYPTAPITSDKLTDVLRQSLRMHAKDQVRPVLTNELADSSNPYVMKRSSLERLIHHSVVRNKLEESLVDKLLDANPSLTKCRAQADAPPEVLEPLNAFRGITEWSFDPRVRLEQKLGEVNNLIDGIMNQPGASSNAWRFNHPFRNHFGFETTAQDARTGGWNVGRPQSREAAEMRKMRYPTLQRVAHSLPKDLVYRSSVIHSINILERSKGWDFDDKTRAINTMKEVYDTLPSSSNYKDRLNRALPLKRPDARKKDGMRPLKTFPVSFAKQGKKCIYHKSFVSTKPLWQRVSERLQKNAELKQKKLKRGK